MIVLPVSARAAKACALVFAAMLAAAGYWAWQSMQPDDEIRATVITPFTTDELGSTDDAYVGLLGLVGPGAMDFMEFGRGLREALRRGEDIYAAVDRLRAGRELLTSSWPSTLGCWLEPEQWLKGTSGATECATLSEVESAVSANMELISRYRKLQTLPLVGRGPLHGSNHTINLSRLLHLEIGLDIKRGNPNEAFDKWLLNHTFQRHMASYGGTWVDFVINLVNESLSYSGLEFLYDMAPEFMRGRAAEVSIALGGGGLERYNFDRVLRSEFNLLAQAGVAEAKLDAGVKVNRIRNRFDDFAREYLSIIERKPADLSGALEEVRARHSIFTFEDLFSLQTARVWQVVSELQLTKGDVIKAAWRQEVRRRHLILRALVAKKGVLDDEIQSFLSSQGPDLRSPIDGRPFSFIMKPRMLVDDSASHRERIETKI